MDGSASEASEIFEAPGVSSRNQDLDGGLDKQATLEPEVIGKLARSGLF